MATRNGHFVSYLYNTVPLQKVEEILTSLSMLVDFQTQQNLSGLTLGHLLLS